MQLHNRVLKESKAFGFVYWVTVSKDFSIHKLQNDVAKVIALDVSNENHEKKRTTKLAEALMRKKKRVLVLNDVWNHSLLNNVGIPAKADGCKLILTRSFDVCRKLGYQVNIKIEPLFDDES